MGKDVREIERGKCACGKREDFMRSDGATCGYSVSRLPNLKLKNARYSCPLTLLMAHRPYNSDELWSMRVDELSLHYSHHKITFKGMKAEKVAVIKAGILAACCTIQ